MTGGWFRGDSSNSGGPNLPVIAATISEIALGMEFLHSQGIVHGDLSSGALLPVICFPLLQGSLPCTVL